MVVELEPGRKMSVDWGDNGIATWELADSGGKTRLTFIQSGFTTPRPPFAGWMGTLAGLASLRRFVEVDPWRPISRRRGVGTCRWRSAPSGVAS